MACDNRDAAYRHCRHRVKDVLKEVGHAHLLFSCAARPEGLSAAVCQELKKYRDILLHYTLSCDRIIRMYIGGNRI